MVHERPIVYPLTKTTAKVFQGRLLAKNATEPLFCEPTEGFLTTMTRATARAAEVWKASHPLKMLSPVRMTQLGTRRNVSR